MHVRLDPVGVIDLRVVAKQPILNCSRITMPHVYTVLNLPNVTSNPSSHCLQWSSDGQLLLVTKNGVHILTPDLGINIDGASAVDSSIEEADGKEAVGWFRNVIEFHKGHAHNWPEGSQDWGAVSLGSLDVSVRSVACSPTNLASGSACVLAVLNSNMDLTLWKATKNMLKGEWTKIQEVTQVILDHYLEQEDLSATAKVLGAQVTSIAWSQQADFGMSPAPPIDASLLAAGTRAGCLVFHRFDGSSSVKILKCIPVSKKWITYLAFSSSTKVEIGKCEGLLAYGTSDGSVGIIKIIQLLEPSSQGYMFYPNHEIEASFEELRVIFEADRRGITAMGWVEISHRNVIKLYSKPGVVHLWSQPSLLPGWSGHRALRLKAIKLSVGSSSLHSVSGFHYIRVHDVLVLSLSDGSFHVIHKLSEDPTQSSLNGGLDSSSLSLTARSIFVRTEQNVDEDVHRIGGMASYDGAATVLWLHETCRPADFSYKHDARHNSTFVMTELWDDRGENWVLQGLSETLDNANSASGRSPLYVLRPFLLHLRKLGRTSEGHTQILEILSFTPLEHWNLMSVKTCSGGSTTQIRPAFRQSLRIHLFGWDGLLSIRMRLSVADFCWKISEDETKQTEFGKAAQALLTSISHSVLWIIIRHLRAVVSTLTASDLPFVVRMVVQSLLPGSPPDLAAEAQNLSMEVRTAVNIESHSFQDRFSEECPACKAEVQLNDITRAVCSNGHVWSRCSITSFILSTHMVRTCIGCSRKAFLPISQGTLEQQNWLPSVAHSWVVEELLEAAHRCLICGNSFVVIM